MTKKHTCLMNLDYFGKTKTCEKLPCEKDKCHIQVLNNNMGTLIYFETKNILKIVRNHLYFFHAD